jgi:hypothetical protein
MGELKFVPVETQRKSSWGGKVLRCGHNFGEERGSCTSPHTWGGAWCREGWTHVRLYTACGNSAP